MIYIDSQAYATAVPEDASQLAQLACSTIIAVVFWAYVFWQVYVEQPTRPGKPDVTPGTGEDG